jgi:hypothetical protein
MPSSRRAVCVEIVALCWLASCSRPLVEDEIAETSEGSSDEMDTRMMTSTTGASTTRIDTTVPEESTSEDVEDERTSGSTFDDATSDSGPKEGTFAEVEAILTAKCAEACHRPGGLWSTFDLTGDIYAKIVGVTAPSQGQQCNLIEPGNPEASYLFRKVIGTHATGCGGAGMQMPLHPDLQASDPLPPEELDIIEGWILDGAPP